MRPKKKILLVGSNENRLSILSYLLETYSYRVTCAATAGEAATLLRAGSYELLLCQLPLDGVDDLLDIAHALDTHLPSMVLRGATKWQGVADAIESRLVSSALILDRVRVLTIRKRGPRPLRKPPVSAPAIVDAARRFA